ncbi:PadR family transcriptional regulator [Nitrospirillum pindoramense]|uniref:PadR family transcriptional regulator PadR n=1 Tax=Nitrospirillum amazonense TaxID=28077 RepID=A0A560HHQ6_9PROT|nr:PadR family transcriptional regulator [Nitrospirillum amazonense]TWB45988.1 PadR family transcriptional regulator PadR [Nitrospirillum amazonense]
MAENNSNFMSGVPELLVLRLVREKEMYGYELVQAIRERSNDAIALGEGVIYPVLHALERDGALSSNRKTVNGRSRVYYSLTATGVRRLDDLAGNWSRLTEAIQSVLGGPAIGGVSHA